VAVISPSVVPVIAYVAQSYHYDVRKEKNKDIPQTKAEAKDSGWLGPDTEPEGPAASFHQFTAGDKPNEKYVSPDGHREAIYDSTGKIVLDSRDIGTYIFFHLTLFGELLVILFLTFIRGSFLAMMRTIRVL